MAQKDKQLFCRPWFPPNKCRQYNDDLTMTAKGKYLYNRSKERAEKRDDIVFIEHTGEIGTYTGFSFYGN